jgi:hypothetical protein
MSIDQRAQENTELYNKYIAANLPTESYFGSKLVQALAEYSGRFRNEFKLNESDPK